jgi:hypothetical protein
MQMRRLFSLLGRRSAPPSFLFAQLMRRAVQVRDEVADGGETTESLRMMAPMDSASPVSATGTMLM